MHPLNWLRHVDTTREPRRGAVRAVGMLLVLLLSGVLQAFPPAADADGCGDLCRRTCCKRTDCPVMRGRCCCSDTDPAGTFTPASEWAVLASGVRIGRNAGADHAGAAPTPSPHDCPSSPDPPPPRARVV